MIKGCLDCRTNGEATNNKGIKPFNRLPLVSSAIGLTLYYYLIMENLFCNLTLIFLPSSVEMTEENLTMMKLLPQPARKQEQYSRTTFRKRETRFHQASADGRRSGLRIHTGNRDHSLDSGSLQSTKTTSTSTARRNTHRRPVQDMKKNAAATYKHVLWKCCELLPRRGELLRKLPNF